MLISFHNYTQSNNEIIISVNRLQSGFVYVELFAIKNKLQYSNCFNMNIHIA